MYLDAMEQVRFEQVRRNAYGDALVVRKPVGVVAGIVPWNVPVRNELKKTIPSILTGCSAVLEPSPESPVAGALLMDVFRDAGLPDGVVNLVVGGAEVGEALVAHPLVRKIAFTGSTPPARTSRPSLHPSSSGCSWSSAASPPRSCSPTPTSSLVGRAIQAFGLGGTRVRSARR